RVIPRVIPQPPLRPLIGNVLELNPNTPVQSMMRIAGDYGAIFRITLPGQDMVLVNDVALATEAADEARFEKIVHSVLRHLRDLAGDALFTAHNHEPNWAKAHRVLMPAFGPGAMRDTFDSMLDIAEQLMTKWERLGPDEVLDVADNMTRLTLDTIALCGFDYRFNSFYKADQHPFVDAMVRSLHESGQRGRRLKLQQKLMFSAQRQFDTDNAYMHGICDDVIARRRAAMAKGEAVPRDLLNLMLTAVDPQTGETLDDVNIRYQLVTFLIAGHETTSGLLSFAVHLLLENPAILQRARAHVDDVLGDDVPRFEHIAQLGYVDQILRETLRLYPTAPAVGVTPKHDTTLGGYDVKKGQVILLLPPTIHRDPTVWHDPERFDPDRFAPDVRGAIPPKAWLPFGTGDRSCIGRAFAMQEATLVLAMLLQRFEIARPAPYTLQIKETLTLKPDGLVITARRRQPPSKKSSSSSSSAATPAEISTPESAAGAPLLVLYGSNAGTAESFARRVASDAALRGYRVQCAPLDDHATALPKDGAVVVVSASYNGQPPDNARAFVAASSTWWSSTHTGGQACVFGCGSRDWAATYQAVPTLIDERLQAAGATMILPRGEADATADFFG
ncbi:MAG TPA: cytochrome P450, partial [Myxococcota bacterium]